VSVLEWRTASKLQKSIAFLAVAATFAIPVLTTPPSTSEAGTLNVGAVQGNANAGLFANPDRGSILRNHLEATKLIYKQLKQHKVDVVIWPENASDISPFIDVKAAQTIRNEVDNILGVPLIFGTITSRGQDIYNSSILWKPNQGPVDWYDKKRPVPFAEYVPDRDFWYQLAPDLVGLISRGYTFGTRDGIFELNKEKLGVLICFEIAIDDIGRDLVREGAQVIISQTNNADFGHSDETFQQVAFAKLRAIETGRAVVNISTVGKSVVYAPDGAVIQQLPTFEPGAMVAAVPLRTSLTPAMIFGQYVDLGLNLLALFFIFRAIRHGRLKKSLLRGEGK
jgi:apolipoprotein N-acyltransferase